MACEKEISVRFTRVIDMINLLTTAQINGTLTGEWDAYTAFHVQRETERLYPYRNTLPTIHWSVAA